MNISERFTTPTAMRRILLIQLGDIGDVVLTLPALHALREAFPKTAISILVREGNGSLLEAGALPPEVFEVRKERAGLWRPFQESLHLIRLLRRKKFDLVFDLRGDERGAYMALLTGAPWRAAYYYPALPWLRNRLFTHLVSLSVLSATTRAATPSLLLLKAFGIDARTDIPELDLSGEVKCRAGKILEDAGVISVNGWQYGNPLAPDSSGGWLTVNPFSRWSYKEWAAEKWIEIVDWLWADFKIATVIVGAGSERDRAAELAGNCSGKVYNLAGRTTLAELAGVLQRSRLHIGVDSAAPHIAAAVGTPTVTLYGPSNWRYWKPPGENHYVVVPDMDCAPCNQKGCGGSEVSRCLDVMEAGQVQTVVRKALSFTRRATSPRRSA